MISAKHTRNHGCLGHWGSPSLPLATPNHEADLNTLGAQCRAVFVRASGEVPAPALMQPDALAQLDHEGVVEVTFSGEQHHARVEKRFLE